MLAKKVAEIADEKKATGIVILDMRKLVNFCDYFVLCSGNTDRHAKAVADAIDEGLQELGIKPGLKDSIKNSHWIVFDAGDVVVHVFEKQMREFYNLEYLWQEAKEVKWESK
ncbi:MAG: ribosome silencing factor [Candidatus Omnitrophota bacterium]